MKRAMRKLRKMYPDCHIVLSKVLTTYINYSVVVYERGTSFRKKEIHASSLKLLLERVRP